MPITTWPLSTFVNTKEAKNKELNRRDMVASLSVDEIWQLFKEKQITAYDKNYLLHEKAHLELDGILKNDGWLKGSFDQTVKHFMKGWENFLEGAKGIVTGTTESKEPALGGTFKEDHSRLYYAALGLWGQIQMSTAVTAGMGDMNAAEVERMAIGAGASFGAARLFGIVADVGTNFIANGFLTRGLATGIKKGGEIAKKLAGEAEKVGSSVKDILEETGALNAITRAMETDGVADAVQIVEKAVKAAGSSVKIVDRVSEMRPTLKAQPTFLETAAKLTKQVTKEDAIRDLPALAKRFNLDLEATLSTGIHAIKPMTERQLYGYLGALEAHVGELSTLAKQALTGTESEQQAFLKYAADLFSSNPGETVKVQKRFIDLLMYWDPDNIARGNIVGARRSFAEDIAQLSPNQLGKLTLGNQDGFIKFGSFWPGMRELYLNTLLPFAWIPSFMGNSIATSQHLAERMIGSAFLGDTSLKSNLYFAKGMQFAMGDAMKAFGEAFTRMDAAQAAQYVAQTGSRLDYLPHQIPGAAGRLINLPMDATLGMDNFFKVMIRRGIMYSKAMELAEQQGLKGAAAGNFVSNVVMNPGFYMANHKEMESVAKQLTFQGDLGYIMKQLQPILQYGPGVLFFPFVKTGANLVNYSWNRTPGLQYASKSLFDDILAGGARSDGAVGRLILGNMTGHLLYELAKEGFITGGAPTDPKLAASWRATHEPYSVGSGKGWHPLSNIDPLTAPIGFMADFVQLADQIERPEAGKVAHAAAISIMRNFPNNTWWRMASDLIDVVQGLKSGEDLTARKLATLAAPVVSVLNAPLIARTKQTGIPGLIEADPITREGHTFMDTVKARIPGWSQEIKPLRDGYGDPIIPPQAIGSPWFGYFSPMAPKVKEATEDRIKQEGDRLHAKLPQFPWTIGGKSQHTEDDVAASDVREPLPGDILGADLTPAQRDQWQEIYREALRHPTEGFEAQVLNNPEFQGAKLPAQRRLFEMFLNKYKKVSKNILLGKDPALMEKVIRSKADNIIQLEGSQEKRQQMRTDIDLQVGSFKSMSPEQRSNLLMRQDLQQEVVEP